MSESVLKNKDFKFLLIAGASSELGSFITDTVIMLWLFDLTGQQKEFLGLSKMCFMIMLTLGTILGGPIGEKLDRKKVLVLCELFRLPLVSLLFFTTSPYLIIAANSAIAFFTGIFSPARQSFTTDLLVDEDRISSGNSLYTTSAAFIHLLGPLIGATLYAQIKSIEFIINLDILSYLIAVLLLLKIKNVRAIEDQENESYLTSLKNGFKYLKERKDLKALFTNAMVSGFSIGILIPLILAFTKEVLKGTDQQYGYLMTVFGLGGLLGGVLSNKLKIKKRMGRAIYIMVLFELIMFYLWSINTSIILCAFILLFWGMSVFTRFPIQLSYISFKTNKNYLSRMHSILQLSFVVPNIMGTAIVATFGDKIDMVSLLSGISASMFAFMLLRLCFSSARALWQEP